MIGTDDGSQEEESHWLPLIGLKDDMKFTPENHSAVKGQTPWCVYFARPTLTIAKIRDYSQSILSALN